MSKHVTSLEFLEALVDAGILQPDDKTERVVIDAHFGAPLRIYIQNHGDERVLNVTTDPSLQIATKVRVTEDEDAAIA